MHLNRAPANLTEDLLGETRLCPMCFLSLNFPSLQNGHNHCPPVVGKSKRGRKDRQTSWFQTLVLSQDTGDTTSPFLLAPL